MNVVLTLIDFAAISPLLIVLTFAMILLLVESFAEEFSKKYANYITLVALILAMGAAVYAPISTNPLLANWLRFDPLARIFNLFFLSIGLGSTLLASAFFERFQATRGEYYFLLLASLFGLMLVGSSADFLTLFLGIETLSIALYILCGYMKKWELSHEASIKYFLMGALGAGFLLYGIALVYGAVGSTKFEHLLESYQGLTANPEKVLFLAGISLITVGLAFKAAIVPFHVWAPDVYDGAPTPVTAFMAVGTKVGAFAAFARIFLVALPQFNGLWNEGVALLAYATLIYANYVAMRQIQLRRFFAYSGISHAGFALIPLVASTPDALSSLLFYLIVYGVATLGAFAVLARLDTTSDGVMLDDLSGLFSRSPFLASTLALCLLTLAGIPPTVGFLAKFYIFKVAFEAGYYALVIVALLTTILSAYYYLRMVSVMFAQAPSEAPLPPRLLPATLVGLASVVVIVVISCFPGSVTMLLR